MRLGVSIALALGLNVAFTTISLAEEAPFSKSEICKAGIALVMGKSPSIMKTSVVGDEVRVSYVRANDGTTWKYKCKLEGSRVLWGQVDGRWRNDPADEPMVYSVAGNGASARLTVQEKYQDGSSNSETFTKDELK